jgi:hypothetical protein
MDDSDIRPPIPASLAARPVRGGIAQAWVNAQLADGGTDFRSPNQERYAKAWLEGRCQSCGQKIDGRAVLVCGPRQIITSAFDEPPVCPPCANYASRACPMVAGRRATYVDRDLLVEGPRGQKCPVPGCDCGGHRSVDPEHSAPQNGQAALPWYACWIPGTGRDVYTVTGHQIDAHHESAGDYQRLIVNGAVLRPGVDPLKIMLVSEPAGTGRVWRRLTAEQATEHATRALISLGLDVPAGRVTL